MLCPCCGISISVDVKACTCGARFVGRPLDDKPAIVPRLGPSMTAVLLLAVVTTAALVFTKWLAFAAVVVIWSANRALCLSRRDPALYGGRRTALATLTVSVLASLILGTVGAFQIPRYFENRKIRQIAATRARMHHVASLLEEYKRVQGSYPRDAQEINRVLNERLPADYWDKSLKYQGYTTAIADNNANLLTVAGLSLNDFELRSAGPDGVEGTDDDVIMRDGVFLTAAEARKQPMPRIRAR